MKLKDHISYYCFNKDCVGSIYFRNSVKITDLPITAKTLSGKHYCSLCNSKLVSTIDIELAQALLSKKQVPVLS